MLSKYMYMKFNCNIISDVWDVAFLFANIGKNEWVIKSVSCPEVLMLKKSTK